MGVVYDFGNPPESGFRRPDLYAAVLEQVTWLDSLNLDLVWFTEHHFVDDGYLPSWIPVASAMAARTRHVRFSCDVCLLPFNHPIRLAEDLAVLDNISNGRVKIGVGLGYAVHEFRGFGLPVSHRLSYTDEGLEVLTRDFPPIREAERRRMALYNQFRAESGGHGGVAGITEEQRIPQGWIVGTLDECVARMAAFITEYGLTDVVCWAVPPGMRPDQMNRHLERYARELVPRLKAMFPG